MCLTSISLCEIANAEITGNASLAYDLIEEDEDWSGEFEQRLGLSFRSSSELGRLLGLNLGFVWYGEEFDFRTGFSPTYSINLQGEHYSLSSGYSVRLNRGIINSRLYENLSLFLPDLPIIRLTYARQGTRDTEEEHKVDSTGRNMQFGVEDEIGPFRITLNRRTYTTENKIRGPEHDVESSNTSGDIAFTHSFGRLLSFNGRYGLEQLHTERMSLGKTKGETENFSLGFRLSPTRTIALSGTTAGRREERESSLVKESSEEESDSTTKDDYLTNRLQLMLQPIDGIRLGAAYSKSDNTRENETDLSAESRSLTVDMEPWHNVLLSGRFTIRESQEEGEKASTTDRKSFDVRIDPLERLQISTRLDQSGLVDHINDLYSDRDSVTTRLLATLTQNLRTDISHDWQKSIKKLMNEVDRDSQHQVGLTINYSFARMLNINFRISRGISSMWGSDTRLSGGLSYVEARSRFSVRYDRTSSPIRSSLLEHEGRRTTQTFSASINQEIGQDTDLSLSYQSRLGSTGLGNRETRRISFRVSSRF